MDASPGGSILKRSSSEKLLPAAVPVVEPEAEQTNYSKVRRVHFPDNPVSDQVRKILNVSKSHHDDSVPKLPFLGWDQR